MNAGSRAWRTLIVDDEPLAREGIRARLTALGGFEVIGECSGGRAAITAIRTQTPDVVFLDVQMPVVDGFAVIAEVGAEAMPAVVFVTAYDHYALKAFDAQAIDYILKPIDDARFARAVDSVRTRLTESRESGVARHLAHLLSHVRHDALASVPPSPLADRLVARDGDRIDMIPFGEIDWVAADGDYVRIHAGNRQLLLRMTMGAMEESLPPSDHVRIHRSTIVNVTRIRTLKSLPNAEFSVVLRNGVTLRASRSYSARLRAALRLNSSADSTRESPTGK
jgi:two-component system, LytTR family, response regulator